MIPRLTYGPLLLLLYQAAPVGVVQDSLGRYRVTVGFAGGRWENEEFGCDGNLLSTAPVRYRSAGVQLDVWSDDHLRLSAFGGTTRQRVGAARPQDSTGYSGYVERYGGAYGGGQIAYEGQRLGLGLGVAHVSGPDGFTIPAPYVRLGDIDGSHLRLEAMTPNPVFPSGGWGRVGIGYNYGHLRGVGGFLGVAVGPIDYNTKALLGGEIRLPLARRFTAQLQGLFGPGENVTQWGAGFGVRYDFGNR